MVTKKDKSVVEGISFFSIPYVHTTHIAMSPITDHLLTKLMTEHELYPLQLIEKIVIDYATAFYGRDKVSEYIDHVNMTMVSPTYFSKERQIAVYENIFNTDTTNTLDKLLRRYSSHTNFPAALEREHFPFLKEAAYQLTKSYHNSMMGFFPSEFTELEGVYVEKLPSKTLTDVVFCDANDDHNRQLTLMINLSKESLHFIPLADETFKSIEVKKEAAILYPSNYSCSYRLNSIAEEILVLKMYRHTFTDKEA